MSRKRVEVAAAILMRPDGHFLLGQRAPDTFYGGYWEFPGGKVEAGEAPRDALVRELEEELGIAVDTAWPWVVREHLYEHAHVRLHFFEVPVWRGEVRDHVHSALAWQRADALAVGPMLPANGPVLKGLMLPRTMGITAATECVPGERLARLDAALAAGLRLVQVRDHSPEAAAREQFATRVLDRCRAASALCVINGDAALAERIGADGLHLPARQLAACPARPDFAWVGASTHDRAELERAAALGLDYALLGPVAPTPSHPGCAGLGWPAFHALTRDLPLPVLALGGMQPADMPQARAAGAHGLAMISAAWRG